MTYNTIEKARSDCDAEGLDANTHKSSCTTGTQRSKAIKTPIQGCSPLGLLFCKYSCMQYVQDVRAQQAPSFGVGRRK